MSQPQKDYFAHLRVPSVPTASPVGGDSAKPHEHCVSPVSPPVPSANGERRDCAGLNEALAAACAPVGLDPAVLRAELGAQDLADYAASELTPEALAAWARGITIRRMRERGEVPAHYTAVTTCQGCGPVPIFPGTPAAVDACPWCFNRLAGLPVPKVTP
jgi:hypothetical protein